MTDAGGIFPEGHVCTVCYGECKICGEKGTIIPWVDYNWKDKKDNLTAHVCRD
jgi:hypothetical protein